MKDLIDRATKALIDTNKPQIIYRRYGKLAILPLQTYIDADLDSKGAKRIAIITKNAAGKII